MNTIDKILKLLKAKGLTQDAFEPKAGLPRGRFTRWKDGTGEPSGRQALVMARLLDVPVEYLLDDEMEEPAKSELPPDEAAILSMYRTLKASQGLDLQHGLDRLAGVAPFAFRTTVKGSKKDQK